MRKQFVHLLLIFILCLTCSNSLAFGGVGIGQTGGYGDLSANGQGFPMKTDLPMGNNVVIDTGAVKFDLTPADTAIEEGKMQWGEEEGTLTIGMPGSTLAFSVLHTLKVPKRCKNTSGSVMPRGTVVYISGGSGAIPQIEFADADTELASSKTIGFTAQDIAINARGYVLTDGLLQGTDDEHVNTAGMGESTPLWLSQTKGEFTAVVPLSPAHAVFLGKVFRDHASVGEIYVDIQNGYEVGELHDVDNALINPTDGESWYYNDSVKLWKQTTGISYSPALAQLIFRDAALGVYSQADSYLDIFTDGGLRVGNSSAGAPTDYTKLAGNDGSLSFTGTARIDWATIAADNVTLTNGTSSDTVSDLQIRADGNAYRVTEAAGVPGIQLQVEYINVTAFQFVCALGAYMGGGTHYIWIQLYNFNTMAWDTFSSLGARGAIESWGNYDFLVADDTNYIGTGGDLGDVRVLFNHPITGNPSHLFELDVVALVK